jgi:hypothetical protein
LVRGLRTRNDGCDTRVGDTHVCGQSSAKPEPFSGIHTLFG